METIDTLLDFIDKNPQKEDGRFNYFFLGGTAVRLNQMLYEEKTGKKFPQLRGISDFDIVCLDSGKYPVHSCNVEDIFSSLSISKEEIMDYVLSTNIRRKEIYFLDQNFVAVSKTATLDSPREKDFEDASLLFEIGFDTEKLKKLYLKSPRITKNMDIVVDAFFKILETGRYKKEVAKKMFGTFPRLVNLLDLFEKAEKNDVFDTLKNHCEKESKSAYEINGVIYGVMQFIEQAPVEIRPECLNSMLAYSLNQDYREFDAIMQRDLLPMMKYSQTREDKINTWHAIKNEKLKQA